MKLLELITARVRVISFNTSSAKLLGIFCIYWHFEKKEKNIFFDFISFLTQVKSCGKESDQYSIWLSTLHCFRPDWKQNRDFCSGELLDLITLVPDQKLFVSLKLLDLIPLISHLHSFFKTRKGGWREVKREEKEVEDEKLKRRNGNNRDTAIEEGTVKSWRRRNRKDRQVVAQMAKLGPKIFKLGQEKAKLGLDVGELGPKMAELGSKKVKLGSKMAKLGLKIAKLGSKMAKLGSKLARME